MALDYSQNNATNGYFPLYLQTRYFPFPADLQDVPMGQNFPSYTDQPVPIIFVHSEQPYDIGKMTDFINYQYTSEFGVESNFMIRQLDDVDSTYATLPLNQQYTAFEPKTEGTITTIRFNPQPNPIGSGTGHLQNSLEVLFTLAPKAQVILLLYDSMISTAVGSYKNLRFIHDEIFKLQKTFPDAIIITNVSIYTPAQIYKGNNRLDFFLQKDRVRMVLLSVFRYHFLSHPLIRDTILYPDASNLQKAHSSA